MGALRAAAGKVDLEPPVGIWLTGYGDRTRGSTGVHDAITARAAVVGDGDKTVAIVSCEVVGWSPRDDAEMRWEIESQTGLPAGNILINCTHTHSGPASMPLRGNMGVLNAKWIASAQQKVVDLVKSLPGQTVPVSMAFAEAEVRGLGYNRQDGGGPQDETLQVLSFEDTAGHAVATLSCYNMHAVVLGPSNLRLSGDFPGAMSRSLEESRGGVALYLQGCCGDIDPELNVSKGWGKGTFADVDTVGERLAAKAAEALGGADRHFEGHVRAGMEHLRMPLKPPPDNLDSLAAEFQEQVRSAPHDKARGCAKAMLSWATELQGLAKAKKPIGPLEATVTALAIGDVCIVGLPFEVYTQIGLDVKALSPFRDTMVLGYSNGLFGYCATDEARKRGGYGPDSSHRWFPTLPTPLADGADRLLVEAVRSAVACCR